MIAKLYGRIDETGVDHLVIDVNGVGYVALAGTRLLARLQGVLDAKRASMAAHATQATGAPDTVRTLAVFLALPEDVFAIAFGTEWFVHRGDPTDPRGADLFASLDRAPS
jgi:hypothetical protein